MNLYGNEAFHAIRTSIVDKHSSILSVHGDRGQNFARRWRANFVQVICKCIRLASGGKRCQDEEL